MLMETLENRRLLAGNAVSEAAQAGLVADLAKSEPAVVAALVRPSDPAPSGEIPGDPPALNAVAAAAKAGTIADTAQADGKAVAALARGL
jgi:hypothetical protein